MDDAPGEQEKAEPRGAKDAVGAPGKGALAFGYRDALARGEDGDAQVADEMEGENSDPEDGDDDRANKGIGGERPLRQGEECDREKHDQNCDHFDEDAELPRRATSDNQLQSDCEVGDAQDQRCDAEVPRESREQRDPLRRAEGRADPFLIDGGNGDRPAYCCNHEMSMRVEVR